MSVEDTIKEHVRDVPDFPKPGILFKDISPLLATPKAWKEVCDALAKPFQGQVACVAGIESRGFMFGIAVAERLGVGFVPIRKPGKLPWKKVRESYSLEYGQDALEIHEDAIAKGKQVLIVDDVLATGGTAAAAVRLVERVGGKVAGVAFAIELGFLNGREKLGKDRRIHALIKY
jgi:adenine phosphoribosyltransferase